jgi:hypothetical protein
LTRNCKCFMKENRCHRICKSPSRNCALNYMFLNYLCTEYFFKRQHKFFSHVFGIQFFWYNFECNYYFSAALKVKFMEIRGRVSNRLICLQMSKTENETLRWTVFICTIIRGQRIYAIKFLFYLEVKYSNICIFLYS